MDNNVKIVVRYNDGSIEQELFHLQEESIDGFGEYVLPDLKQEKLEKISNVAERVIGMLGLFKEEFQSATIQRFVKELEIEKLNSEEFINISFISVELGALEKKISGLFEIKDCSIQKQTFISKDGISSI